VKQFHRRIVEIQEGRIVADSKELEAAAQ
jgi:hypothetical protein